MISVIPLDWDSSFFGLRIARVEITSFREAQFLLQTKSEMKKEFDLIYVFCSQSIPFFEGEMELVDTKVNYIVQIRSFFEEQPLVKRWESTVVSPDLIHLALLSGKYSRFNTDKHFPQGSYEKLYSHWIEQSVNHIIASDVFCYLDYEKIPRGLLTLNIKDSIGTIGLLSVDNRCRQKGIGSSMLRHAINYSYHNQVEKLFVATQSKNIPACHLYEKNGFIVDSIVNVWHWWL